MKIDTALILCAGYGTRLKPLTDSLPKPLLKVRGKPMVCHILDKLIDAGLDKFFINIHHLPEKFLDYFDAKSNRAKYRGCQITFVTEAQEILDTGGGLKNILPITGVDTPILVHNGDIFFDAPIKDFVDAANKNAIDNDCAATLCLRDSGNLSNVGVCGDCVVDMRFSTRVKVDKNMQFCGVFVAGTALLNSIFNYDKKVFSIIDIFLQFIEKNKRAIRAFTENGGEWVDIGTPREYVEINKSYPPDRMYRLAQLRTFGFYARENSDISKGGSMRDFFRFTDESGAKLIACFYSEQKRENFLYAQLAQFLFARKFPVPEILFHSEAERALIMRDLGLQDLLLAKEKSIYYNKAISHIKRLHSDITDDFAGTNLELSQPFDNALYDWEQSYFFNECVKKRFLLEIEMPLSDFKKIKETLLRGKQVLLHRDLQSQNIIVSENGDVGFIDFQGMRLGNPYYDLASLLYDPYVSIDNSLRQELLREYIKGTPTVFKDAEQMLHIAACERLMQALGAYGFLSIEKGLAEYEKYFAPALDSLRNCANLAKLDGISDIAKKCIAKLK